jgi:glycosyltransferase involved in cell wall biosynthesis
VRIGVNALYLIPGGVGGTEIYLRELLAALAGVDRENRYLVFTNRETGSSLVPAAPNFEAARLPVRAAFRPARILWEQTGLPLEAARRRLDVLLNPGFTAPVCCTCPSVTVFHDLQHKRHPEFFRWHDLPFWRLLLWAAAHCSRRIIAVSEATRRDLLRFYRLPPGKIDVVPHGVGQEFFEAGRRRAARRQEPFLLAVSTLHPHKNLDRLVRVFARFRERRPDFRLVIAGMRGFFAAELERRIGELGLADAVELAGWVPRETLLELYERAWAYVNPTLFEGFGMPVLEALAAGVPVACSAIDPLREVAGASALLFDPGNEDEMLAAIECVVEDDDERRRLAAAGPARAARFTWRAAAEATLAVLHAAARRHPAR